LLAWAPVSTSGTPAPAVAYCLVMATPGGPVAQTINACAPEVFTLANTALNSEAVVWNSSVATRVTPYLFAFACIPLNPATA
jgi:hypothetical protein